MGAAEADKFPFAFSRKGTKGTGFLVVGVAIVLNKPFAGRQATSNEVSPTSPLSLIAMRCYHASKSIADRKLWTRHDE
jgi:hypothetical protein